MPSSTPQTTVRLAPEIREDLQRFAREHGITINAAVNLLLRQALRASQGRPAA